MKHNAQISYKRIKWAFQANGNLNKKSTANPIVTSHSYWITTLSGRSVSGFLVNASQPLP